LKINLSTDLSLKGSLIFYNQFNRVSKTSFYPYTKTATL